MAEPIFDPLTLAAWSRFAPLREHALRRLEAPARAVDSFEPTIRILFGGDVMFDPVVRRPWYLRNLGLRRGDIQPARRPMPERIRRSLWRRLIEPLLSSDCYSAAGLREFYEYSPAAVAAQPQFDWTTVASDFDYPFRRIRPLFEGKDLVVVNLETPLTKHARDEGMFKSHPGYAAAMRAAGVSMVNLSNNHLFDAGEEGLLDTIRHVRDAGIEYVGVGDDLVSARAGKTLDVRGTRILFLSYTQYCNGRFASLADTYPGLLPLAEGLMVEDVRAAAEKAHLVIVSVHWGIESQPSVHPRQVALARRLIDAGAGAIVGHHPHVPHGIEVYRGRPIVYSLGNLIFAQGWDHRLWGDNVMAELVVAERQVRGVILHPITGRGPTLFQPEPLRGTAARALLQRLQLLSVPFRTRIAVGGDVGYIAIDAMPPR
jgi:poly-gamma-glutamate synthesis protein (capsule biosynthesis protein)